MGVGNRAADRAGLHQWVPCIGFDTSAVFGTALAPQTSLYDIFYCEHQDQLAHAEFTP